MRVIFAGNGARARTLPTSPRSDHGHHSSPPCRGEATRHHRRARESPTPTTARRRTPPTPREGRAHRRHRQDAVLPRDPYPRKPFGRTALALHARRGCAWTAAGDGTLLVLSAKRINLGSLLRPSGGEGCPHRAISWARRATPDRVGPRPRPDATARVRAAAPLAPRRLPHFPTAAPPPRSALAWHARWQLALGAPGRSSTAGRATSTSCTTWSAPGGAGIPRTGPNAARVEAMPPPAMGSPSRGGYCTRWRRCRLRPRRDGRTASRVVQNAGSEEVRVYGGRRLSPSGCSPSLDYRASDPAWSRFRLRLNSPRARPHP